MSEKTINCPSCKEPILVDFEGENPSYLCPGCHQVFNIAKKTRRTRRTGVVVDGQSFSVKEQANDGDGKKGQVKAAHEDWKKNNPSVSFHDRVLTNPKKTGQAPQPPNVPPQGYPQGYPPGYYPPQGYPPGYYPPQGYPPGYYPPQGYPPGYYPPQGAPVPPQYPLPQQGNAEPTLEEVADYQKKQIRRQAGIASDPERSRTVEEDEDDEEEEIEFTLTPAPSPALEGFSGELQPPVTPAETPVPSQPERRGSQSRASAPPPPPEEEYEEDFDEDEYEDAGEMTYEESGHVRRSKKRALTALISGVVVVVLFGAALYFLHGTEADPFNRAPVKTSSPVLGSGAASPAGATPGKASNKPKIDFDKLEKGTVSRPEVPVDAAGTVKVAVSGKATERALKARETAVKFLAANTLDERKKFSRITPDTEARMRNYYLTHPEGAINYVLIDEEGVETLDPRFIAFRVVLGDSDSRYIGLEATPDGYKVDWESFVVYSDMQFDQFEREKPTKPLQFRVFVEPADYFNNQFMDREKFVSYRLISSDPKANLLYGYTEKGGEVEEQINELIAQGEGRPVAVILTLHYPDHAIGSNQVVISQLVSNGWMRRE